MENPSYEQVKTGETGHVEVVKVVFDSKIISYEMLIEVFMNVHDPTQADGQGEDLGSQYVSAIFCSSEIQKEAANKIIEEKKKEMEGKGRKIVTQVRKLEVFYEAEEYHKNYYNERGSSNSYCNIIPGKIAKMRKLFKDLCVEEAWSKLSLFLL